MPAKKGSIVKNTFWATLARVFQVAVKAFAVIFIARWLGPSEFGLFTLVLSTVALGAVFVDFGIAPGTARLLAEGQNSHLSIFRTSVGALVTALIVGGVLLFSLGEYFFEVLNAPRLNGVVGLFFGLLSVQVFYKYGRKIFEGLRRVDLSSKIGLSLEWAPWGLAFCATAFIQARAEYALVGKLLGTCLVIVGLGVVAWRLVKASSVGNGESVKVDTLLRYSFPMMLTAASFYVYSHSDILLIQAFLGEAEVGVYGVAVRLLDTLHVPAAAIGSAAAAFFVSTKRENPAQLPGLFQNVTRGILIFYLPLVIGLILTAERLIPFLFGEEYSQAALVAVIYAPTLLMKGLSGTYSLALDYLGYARQRAMAVTLSAILNLGLNFFMIPRWGIVGAAITTQITYVPLVCWYAYMLAELSNAKFAEVAATLRPTIVAAALMGAGLLGPLYLWDVHVLVIVLLGAGMYGAVSLLNGAISKKDVALITDSITSRS